MVTDKQIIDIVHEGLATDIISRGELHDIITDYGNAIPDIQTVGRLLTCILESDVEICNAVLENNYVASIGWKGSIGEKVNRALKIENDHVVSNCDDGYKYWLCKKCNVDRYEI